jgi:HEPN domain-containing protein
MVRKSFSNTEFLKWLSKRETARYVDFEAGSLSIPEENFDESDAEEILEDAQATLEFVSGQIEE